MKVVIVFFFACFFQFSLFASDDGSVSIVPEPVSVRQQPGSFLLTNETGVVVGSGDRQLNSIVDSFIARLRSSMGLKIAKRPGGIRKGFFFTLNDVANPSLGKEGYSLSVKPDSVILNANTPAGIFYGLQTVFQLLPAGVERKTPVVRESWAMPCVEITDYPRFSWRGLMLDVSRHFFTKEEVKSYIDEMAKYKFNIFHWHLTDDQGWRIEIKQLPELTKTGAWRVPRTGTWWSFDPPLAFEKPVYGGFYSQEDIREIVKYAQERFITILPEIDVPGHSLAMIAAYPDLSSSKQPASVNPGSKFYTETDNVLDPSNEDVFKTLDKVFTEVAKLFPCEYIHIGGDEAYKGFWENNPSCRRLMDELQLADLEELQSYFIKRVEKILKSKGKKLIGWDEILQGGIAPDATVMSWRGMAGGVEAAKMKHHVIMTPWDYCYLDLYQGEPLAEPQTYGLCRLTDCYHYEPVPDSVDEEYILGGQGNLWTESVPSFRQVQYMTWPRAFALAEVYWSPKSHRNWNAFVVKLDKQFERLDAAGIKYARSAYNVLFKPEKKGRYDVKVTLNTEIPGLDIHYTVDNTFPDNYSLKYSEGQEIVFPEGASQLIAVTYKDGLPAGRQIVISKEELLKRTDEKRHEY